MTTEYDNRQLRSQLSYRGEFTYSSTCVIMINMTRRIDLTGKQPPNRRNNLIYFIEYETVLKQGLQMNYVGTSIRIII